LSSTRPAGHHRIIRSGETAAQRCDRVSGRHRITAQLARSGIAAGAGLVRLLMGDLGLVACQPRPWRPSTTQQGPAGPIPDLVNRDFTADVPGQKMVGDITYIPTWEGWLYLAKVIDCATRKVAGWAMAGHYRTPLITEAIEMAVRNMPARWCGLSLRSRQQLHFWRVRRRTPGPEYPPVRRPDRHLL
jgi:transposase InsO family protein